MPSGRGVTNDVPSITLDLSTQWRAYQRPGVPDLNPAAMRSEMDDVLERVYRSVNNGVYRCGFAGHQDAYEAAYEQLFSGLDWLSHRLADQRYLMGDTITEADVRLFTTLVRFDAVYHGYFSATGRSSPRCRCCGVCAGPLPDPRVRRHGRRRPHPAALPHRPPRREPTGIVPKGLLLEEWAMPHDRERLSGRPFGSGTAPGPVPAGEVVPPEHNLALAPL